MQKTVIIAIAASLWLTPGLAAPADQNSSTKNSNEPTLLLIIPQKDEAAQPQAPSAAPEKESKDAGPPLAAHGENKLSADEARSKLESDGFAEVSELKKTDDGLWLGKAQRDGQSFEVAIDSDGNIFFRQAS